MLNAYFNLLDFSREPSPGCPGLTSEFDRPMSAAWQSGMLRGQGVSPLTPGQTVAGSELT